MENAIVVNNLGKKYKIGQPKKLGDALPIFLSRQKLKEFWALKNINITVKTGESLGIVGSNGSGKSTLLKILSGVTTQTSGSFTISGKVASLLEVGTGFHPDFTGRENIFLYGTLLRMSLNDIRKKFDQIVKFSGVKKFLDTPVKHYSSGMYIRLAFSVAIHLDWDILLIDEVLAVGDEEFQKKSYDKLSSLIKSDKTVILVSHNVQMVEKLCTKVLFLNNGSVQKAGRANSVIDYYLKNVNI